MASATVDATAEGVRLDQFVARLIGASVHAARRLIAEGRVSVTLGDMKSGMKKGLRLMIGQQVVVDQPGDVGARGAILPEPEAPLAILYSDDHLVVVNKGAGIPSHPLRAGEMGTLANALVARFPDCAAAGDDPREAGLGHRLDNGTSGVVIAARQHDVWMALRAALKGPGCEKTYLAEVVGRPPPRGIFEEPIGRRGRRGNQVIVGGQGRNPLPAVTAWETIDERASSTLLRVRLNAGRAHQVRAHLAAAGHPLVGDTLYGLSPANDLPDASDAPAPRLHAESIRLLHPVSGLALFFAAPPPGWANIQPR